MSQIYTKTNGEITAMVIVGDKGQIYLNEAIKGNEITAIRRCGSYIKNMLPYEHNRVDIFSSTLKGSEIIKDEYLKRLKFPIEIGNESTLNKSAQDECSKTLVIETRWNNLQKMQEFNKGR